MKYLTSFAAFWYDFIIGDDWRLAVGVVAGLAATGAAVHLAHASAWWLLPVIVVLMLAVSVRIGARPPERG